MKDQYKMKYFVLFTGWVIASVANAKSVAEKQKRPERVLPTANQISNAEDCPWNLFKDDDGNCTDCPSGSYGKNCSDSCPEGFFGKYCSYTCSCTAGEECDTRHGCILIRTDEETIKYTSLQNLLNTLWKNSTEYGFDKMADTSSQASVDEIPTAVPGSDGTTTISIRGKRDFSRDIEPFIKYIVSGVLLIIIINVCCCIILKRHVSQKNFKRSHNAGNELQGTFEEVESSVMGDERALRPVPQQDDAGYAEITEVESLYADHADDEYHVLSFSRNRRVNTKQNNSSIYHHVDINIINKDRVESSENGSSTSVEEVQTTLRNSVSQQNEIDEIADANPFS